MGRRIFEEGKFDLAGRVLSLEDFRLFCDRSEGLSVLPEYRDQLIGEAERLLGKTYPTLRLAEYLMFRRMGNRRVFEVPYFERRRDMMVLALAEYLEGQGRFADQLCDLVWMILEETTWVLPAHSKEKTSTDALAYGTVPTNYIDLFSAATGADLAVVYYLCRDVLDSAAVAVGQRVLHALNERIVRPFLDESCVDNGFWLGLRGKTNNWCPWINSNVLTVCALTVEDTETREAVVRRAMTSMDNFTVGYHEDGGCDEGPNYWSVAGGALFNACLVLYDMTGGYVNVFRDPLMVNMCEYIVKANVSGEYFLTFADSHAKIATESRYAYDWALLSGSRMAADFWGSRAVNSTVLGLFNHHTVPYRFLRQLAIPSGVMNEHQMPRRVWMEGLCIAATRENTDGSGLYLAMKGGHNAESHNHNDVGNFVVFADGKPLLIDAGVGEYTKKTFSSDRYSIWSMRSDYHNLPTFCGVPQEQGKEFCATDVVYDEATGGLSFDLTSAYPPEARLSAYRREAWLSEGEICVADTVTLCEAGDVSFSLICREKPSAVTADSFLLDGRRVRFDASLTFACEVIDCSDVETRKIPAEWGVSELYRVTLSSKLEGRREYRYDLKID